METQDIFQKLYLITNDNYKEGNDPISNSELLKKLPINPSDPLSEHCIFFYETLLKDSSAIFDNPCHERTNFLIQNISTRTGYFENTTNNEKDNFIKKEFLLIVTKENLAEEMIELRNLNKDFAFHKNLYLSKFGKFDLIIKENNLEIRTLMIAIELKQDKSLDLNDEGLLEKARTELDDLSDEITQEKADLNGKERLFTQLQIANSEDLSGKIMGTDDYSSYIRERRNYIKKFTPYLAVDQDRWSKLTPLQQERIQDFQLNFVSNIKNEEIILNKNSMFVGVSTNFALESLLFQAEEIFSATGIDLPDHIIVYDCPSIDEMIEKLNRGILFYQFEFDKIKNMQQQICENPEYLKYLKLNALPYNEHQALLKNYSVKIEELQDQILKLDKEFRGI